jgi:hypothetical protein
MTEVTYQKLLTEFRGNAPASLASILRCQGSLSFRLPADYVQFMLTADGGEGFIGKHYLMLWPLAEVIKENTGTYYAEAAPELLPFGSNGGSEAFAFDTRSTPASFVMVPFIGMELDVAQSIAPTFRLFLEALFYKDELL